MSSVNYDYRVGLVFITSHVSVKYSREGIPPNFCIVLNDSAHRAEFSEFPGQKPESLMIIRLLSNDQTRSLISLVTH